jgi:hypothetical protein
VGSGLGCAQGTPNHGGFRVGRRFGAGPPGRF